MSNVGSSIGVGGSPSILARALPSPLSGSWPSPTGLDTEDEDILSQYVANLGPHVGTNVTPPVRNTPPAGTGTPSPARSSGPRSPLRNGAVGVGAGSARVAGLSTRNLPGRAPTPPGRGYLSTAARGRPGPSRPLRGGKQPCPGLGGRPRRGGKQPRRGLGRGRGGGGGGDSTSPFHGRRRRRERLLDPSSTRTSTYGSRRVTVTIGNLIERSTSDGQRSSYCRHNHHHHHHHHVQRWWSTSRHPQFYQCSKLKGSRKNEYTSHFIEWDLQ